ncbi:MAG TPA: DUF1841 family protein [Methylophaga sp.]|nr:DUF1841 family protein [Methylophaga sp.]
MFGQDRDTLRQYYHQVWQKWQQQQPLSALEKQIAVVIQEHPEYHAAFADNEHIQQEFFVENGQSNPYLHMGLHLAIREQVATNRPVGINDIYQQLLKKHNGEQLTTEHMMMECLAESIWQAQRSQQMPDEAAYLQALRQYCR